MTGRHPGNGFCRGFLEQFSVLAEGAKGGDLDRRLLAAHATGDRRALLALYAEAGVQARREGKADAAGFYLTQAYVYALDCGDGRAKVLHGQLKAWGREE